MFRPFRLVLTIVMLSLTLGFAGLRTAAPSPEQAFGAMSETHFDLALKIYGKIYSWANNAPMPDLNIALSGWGMGDGPRAPEVGSPGFSESDMGRNLSALRERQTGVRVGRPSTANSYSELVGQVRNNLKAMDISTFDEGASKGPPKAEARRIAVGQ